MAGEDEIVVMVDDAPEPGGDHIVLVDETGITAGTVKKVSDDPVATLKSQLAERQAALDTANQQITSATAAATQATQRARQAEQEATDARTQVAQSQRTTVDSGIAAAKAEADAAEEAYKAAFEAGDASGVAKAQRRISRAETEMAMLEQAKGDMAVEPQRKDVRTEAPRAADDPVESFISSRTAPTQNWLRSHRDYLTDPKKNAKMQAAHFDAESEGIALDSPQYFEHIERFLGMKKDAGNGADQPQSQRRPTAPVAPVTNSGGGMSGEGQSVRLTKGEAEAATDGTIVHNTPDPTGKNRWKVGDPIGLQEAARRKIQNQRDGRYHNYNIDGT